MKELYKLLGKITGWGDMCCVRTRYCEVITYVSHDETARTGRWVFVASVTICGDKSEPTVEGQGATLDAALLACATNVIEWYRNGQRWHQHHWENATVALDVFKKEP